MEGGAAAASPRAWREGRPLGTAPGVRRPPTPQAPAFLSPSLRGEPGVCNGFSSPETVVLLQPDASEPSAWRQLLSCPSTGAPTRPADPRSSPLSSPAAAAAATPSTHPDPASQLRRERRAEREESQIPEEEGGANPHGFAIGRGTGRQRRGKEAEGQRKKEVNPLRSGPLAPSAPSSDPSLVPSGWGSGLSWPPAFRPPSLSLLLSGHSEHPS